jgi:hypothetical protein
VITVTTGELATCFAGSSDREPSDLQSDIRRLEDERQTRIRNLSHLPSQ